VTRAAEQSGGLRERLLEAGYDVLEVPVIGILEAADGGAALRTALAALSSYDWVAVTSPNGAKRVADALAACDPARRPRVAVVGPGTRDAIRGPVDLVASDSIGEGLVDAFGAGPGRVLLAQAEAARTVVADGLRAKGWTVDAVTAYRTDVVPVAAELCERAARADAVVFTSGSTVRGYLRSAGPASLPPVVVSIGPATTAVADELGVPVTVTAAVHTLDGVVAALIGALQPDRG
jgi:uroporphyrinogen-III synthase